MFGQTLRLAAATAERDERTQFLISSEAGPVVFVPQSLTTIIQRALRSSLPSPVEAWLGDQQETLESSGNREIAKTQPLSDWRLHLSTSNGTLKMELSAALKATQQIPGWQKRAGNFWTVTDGVEPRIAMTFEVDAATRAASCGFPGLDASDEASAKPIELTRSSLLDFRLEDAPIGRDGRLYAYTPAGGLVSLYDGGPGVIALSPTVRLKRGPSGFVADYGHHVWPRIWLHAFDINAVVDAIRSTSKLTMELNDGYFGDLQQHHGFYECYEKTPNQWIQRARLQFGLDLSGLSLSYDLFVQDLEPSLRGPHSPGWLQGRFTLPWELLIIRFPVLTNDRAKILAARHKAAGIVS